MMRFILRTTQEAKKYTEERILLGDRKGSIRPMEDLLTDWMKEYLRANRLAEAVPRFTLRDAMREVLVNGAKKKPEERIAWNGFVIEPRKGWKKEQVEETKTMSWEDYLAGKEVKEKKEGDNRVVKPDLAVRALLEKGLLRFKWGTVQLQGTYEAILSMAAAQKGVAKEEILRKVVQVDFMKNSSANHSEWKVDFILEG